MSAILTKIAKYLGKQAIQELWSAFLSWTKHIARKKKAEATAEQEDRDEATDNLNDLMR